MPKISGLIFSADPIKETLAAAEHLLEFADEVVIVYSKSYSDYKRFKSKNKDKRIRIFYALRLGYPEPFRAYGIGLCRYDKIAMLDVDERFSSTEAAKRLLDSDEADIYRLQRHEITPNNKKSTLYTKQYRLFRKGSLEWGGLLHETPKVHGKVKDVKTEEMHIIHNTGMQKSWNYNKINDVFPINSPMHMALRGVYVEHGFGIIGLREAAAKLLSRYAKYKKMYHGLPERNKEIVSEIKTNGIIKYLGLDSENGVLKSVRRYSSRKQGIALLIRMLYDRYDETHHK